VAVVEDVERDFGFVLYDAARLMRRDFDRRARTLGLGRAQWSVLAHLARCEGAKQAELADVLDVLPITLGRQIDRLEQGGWIVRRPDPKDRRVRRLYLTEAARPILDELRSLAAETRARTLAGLDPSERLTLMNLLSRVRENLASGAASNTGGEQDSDD